MVQFVLQYSEAESYPKTNGFEVLSESKIRQNFRFNHNHIYIKVSL